MKKLGIQYQEKGDTIKNEGVLFENWGVSMGLTMNIRDLLL